VLRDSIDQRSRIARQVLSPAVKPVAISAAGRRARSSSCLSQAVPRAKKTARQAQGRSSHSFLMGEFAMRTNVEFGALESVEPAEMKSVEGGIAIAFDASAGSMLSKYVDQIKERLSPTPNVGEPLDLDKQRQYP
jgi:hypothetical protein